MNLAQSRPVHTRYIGGTLGGSSKPLSLASADFDEDGMPDLASGYATGGGAGAIVIHRGNVDALWPYGAALRNGEPPAFLPDAQVVAVPEEPDFLGAGDFDADGHWDIVAAHRGSNALWFLRGDGRGGFYQAERIALPGGVTALVTGELNRPDGLTDIAVALAAPGPGAGARVMIFESPGGALRGEPEVFPLPTAAAALAVADLDGDTWNDLAIGAGKELFIVHSRDRKLSLSTTIRGQVTPARVTRQSLPFVVQSLAEGAFASHKWRQLAALGDDGKVHLLERPGVREIPSISLAIPGPDGTLHIAPGAPPPDASAPRPAPAAENGSAELVLRGEIAVPGLGLLSGAPPQLVTARVSAGGTQDLIVVHGAARKLHIVSRDRESMEPAVHLAASLDTAGAAMAAIPMRLHPHPLHDLITLEAGVDDLQVIHPQDVTTFIVTNTNDSGTGSLREAINGSTQTHGSSSIIFNIPSTDPNRDPTTGVFTITPIGVVNGFNNVTNAEPLLGGPAVTIDGYTQPGAKANTLVNGDNAVILIRIDGAKGGVGSVGLDTFGGTTDTIRGLQITGFDSPLSLPTGDNTGGTGIEPDGGNDFVEGNFVGTNSTGTSALPNYNGVIAFGSSSPSNGSTIGGTTPQARNLISGNTTGFGSALVAVPNTFLVQGNYIGTEATGTLALANGGGVGGAAENVVIGGTTAGAGNLLAGNGSNAYSITIASNTFGSSYIIQGNLIGTDFTGKVALPAFSTGVVIGSNGHVGNQYPTALNNTVGGTSPAARNIISGNAFGGIVISDGADSTLVQGNYIGVDVTGAKALGNGSFQTSDGIFNGTTTGYSNSTPPANTMIGGEFPGAGNVISGNSGNGVQIVGLGSAVRINVLEIFGNAVEGNFIGTDAGGTNSLPNKANGIYVNTGGGLNLIGDPGDASGNLIAFNAGNGVLVDPGTPSGQAGTGNSITGNTIFSNSGAGVRMPSGLSSPISRNSIYSNTTQGIDTATSGPNAQSSCGSGSAAATLLQNAPVLTSATGSTFITATATDPSGNTSEFSRCAQVTPVNNVVTVTGTLTATEPNAAYTVELFQNDTCVSGVGQGKHYLGNLPLTTTSNCSVPISTPIDLSKADLSVTLSPDTYGTQGIASGLSYTMSSVMANLGAADATNVVYTATLPSGFTFGAATTTKGSCAYASGKVTCNIGNLASGGTVNLTVKVTISASTAGNQTTTATVTATQTDPKLSNNTATLVVGVIIPFPQILSFNPAYLTTGSPDSTLAIIGAGFFPGSTVTFNSVTLAHVTFVDYRTLNVVVPAALLATYGTYPVVVSNGSGQFQTTDPFNLWVRTPCSFTLSSYSGAVGAAGNQNPVSFNVTMPAGCSWEVYNPGFYPYTATETSAATDSIGDLFGSGTVSYTVSANTGAPSIYTIELLPAVPEACGFGGCGPPLGQGANFTIYQGGAITCTYTLSANSVSVPVGGVVGIGANGFATGSGTFDVNVSDPRCIPSATTNVGWITQQGQGGSTDQWEEDYNVSANFTGAARSGAVVIAGLKSVTGSTPNIATLNFTVNQAGPTTYSPCDVNQDTLTNVADVQQMINESLGKASPADDLNATKTVNVVDIQIVINAVLKLGCSAG